MYLINRMLSLFIVAFRVGTTQLLKMSNVGLLLTILVTRAKTKYTPEI